MAVDSYIQRMFGEKSSTFSNTKVLMVGAGGIGCELLKDLIMMNIGEIHVLDLDTIDLSNLNRQFLFRQKDIKHSKSKTAIEAVKHFNHKSQLFSYHGSIMDKSMFPLSFFQRFDIIYNALDNLEARFYVNRIALYLNIPLYESGTTGLKGQAQPIYPYLTECFECVPKETPKTFPVCTIRSTPSKPVHCITWAKDFLFIQLFVETENNSVTHVPDNEEISKEEKQLQEAEVNELMDLKNLIATSNDKSDEYIEHIFRKIFIDDIEKLSKIEELWKSRERPTPLTSYEKKLKDFAKKMDYQEANINSIEPQYMLEIFKISLLRLSKRFRKGEKLEFDKDDVDTLRFVMSAANLRSLIFHIQLKSEFDVKQIAGNIIPAVATTNAIMAGFSALSSVNYYLEESNEKRVANSRMVFDSTSTEKVINSSKLIKPSSNCKACSITKSIIELNLSKTKVSDLRNLLLKNFEYADDVEIMTLNDSKLIYDYDLDDNLEKNLDNFIKSEDVLLINDSEEILDLIELYVIDAPSRNTIEFPFKKIPLKKLKTSESEKEDVTASGDALSNNIIVLDVDENIEENTRKRHLDGGDDVTFKKRKLDATENDDLEVIEL